MSDESDIVCDYNVIIASQAPATRTLARDARRDETSLGNILQTQLVKIISDNREIHSVCLFEK